MGLDAYRQCVMPNGTSRARVAWAMRPNPRKPTLRVGEVTVVLSWGPQKAKGHHGWFGHYDGSIASGST